MLTKIKNYLTFENLSWVFIFIVTFLLGNSAVSKLFSTPDMVAVFTKINMLQYMHFIGVLELLALTFLIIPRYSLFGVILVNCLMSGAVVAHLSYMGGSGILFPVIVGLSSWGWYLIREFFIEKK
jgi:hypothetical protein